MHPYRDPPARDERRGFEPDDAVLCVLLIVIGLVPMLVALLVGAPFGFEASLGALMVAGGLGGLVVGWVRRRAEP